MAFSPLEFSVTSAGLTTTTPNYSNGDTLGTIIEIANAANASGGFGHLRNLRINDYSDLLFSVTVFVYRSSPTLAADNAAWSVSDADSDALIDMYFLPFVDNGANRQASIRPHTMYKCAATSLYLGLRADSITAGVAGAATDIRVLGLLDRVL